MPQRPHFFSDDNDYGGQLLPECAHAPLPLSLFKEWFAEASERHLLSPQAMTLATVDQHNRPHARIVLLKDLSDRGDFIFYTNYESEKAHNLSVNPYAALVFFWPALFRQVRVEGRVTRLPRKESDHYFASRPLDSQVSAIASPQSQPIPDRRWLVDRCQALQRCGGSFSCPSFWGGFSLLAHCVEFWQGQNARLHDRLRYKRDCDDGVAADVWSIERLAP